MTETAHTPLPWEAQVLETENDPGVYIVGSNLGGLVCAALPWPTEIESGDYSRVEANAAFIVHAVNSHHDLIEALREELVWHEDHDKAISKQPNANTGDNGWRRMEHQERIAALTAILTKAEAGHG